MLKASLEFGLALFEGGEFIEHGLDVSAVGDGFHDSGDAGFDGAQFYGEAAALLRDDGILARLAGGVFDLDLADVFRIAEVVDQLLQDGVFNGFAGDEAGITAALEFGVCAGVIVVGEVLFAAGDGLAIHECAAAGTAHEAGEDVAGTGAAGMIFSAGDASFEAASLVEALDGLESLFGDHRLTIIFDDLIAVVKLPQVDAIFEKVAQAAVGGVEAAGRGADLVVGSTLGAHLPGEPGTVPGFGIRNPARNGMGFAAAVGADGDDLTLEAAGRGAGHAAVFADEVAEAASDVGGEVLEEAGVHPVDRGLEKAAVEAVWNLVFHAEDGVPAPAEICLVELRVVNVAGEAGKLPDDDALFLAIGSAEVAHHLLESFAGDGGGTRAGFIFENLGEDVALLDAPGADLFFLLLDGEFLVIASGVAEVGGVAGRVSHFNFSTY